MIDIEALERLLREDRQALKANPNVVEETRRMQGEVPKVKRGKYVMATQIGEKEAIIGVVPVEMVADADLVRAARFDLTRSDIGTQSRLATFKAPVRITDEGVWIQSHNFNKKGAQRVRQSWEMLDPSLAFSGSKDAQKTLKALGVVFK